MGKMSRLSEEVNRELEYFLLGLEQLRNWKPDQSHVGIPKCQVIDLFSGCGGMSLGFAALGRATGAYKILGGVDINRISSATYRTNFGVPGYQKDLMDFVTTPRELDTFLECVRYDRTMPLVLIGCAPCQGFTAHRKRNWGHDDIRNGLVETFAEIAKLLKPEWIVMENVPELLSGRYWRHFENFTAILSEYNVRAAIHNAATFGTPQERFRAVVFASKRDSFSLPSPWLKAGSFKTVRDAIGDLPPVGAGVVCPTDAMHRSASHRPATLDVIRQVNVNGGSRPPGVGPKCLDNTSGYADVYGRLYWDRPSITITHYARNPASGRFTHPEQLRGLTMREAARLQGFPDGFLFEGGFDDVFRQIGEAVPPFLSTAIAASLLAQIEGFVTNSPTELVTRPVNDSYASVIAGIKERRR